MKTLKTATIGTFLTLLLATNLYSDCSYELFSISSTKDTKIIDFVEQLSDECEFTVIITDPETEKFLNSNLNKTHLKNLTINEVFNIILNENDLSYTLENNILRISYLTTKIFPIDYILTSRSSTTKTDVTLSSSSAGGQSGGDSSASSEAGVSIQSSDEVLFWEKLDDEFRSILNRPHDRYEAGAPVINKNAGLVTVTATIKQMTRFEDYLKQLQEKVQQQVLIDVQILSVTMKEGHSTGVDWNQLYKLQNFSLSADAVAQSSGVVFEPLGAITTATKVGTDPSSLVQISASVSMNEVIKFLNTQGDVSSISNPKVLTLNNQPALITVGTEYFYKLTNTETLAGGTSGAQSSQENVQSVFAGILLDITPEIADDSTITLKINPSISETTKAITTTSAERKMPPDLDRRQLSSVVTVKDGNRVILGGLINTRSTEDTSQVPLLGSIPVLGYLFKYEEMSKTTQELIIIIEPHIIDKESKVSLKELGYRGLTDVILKASSEVSTKLDNVNVK